MGRKRNRDPRKVNTPAFARGVRKIGFDTVCERTGKCPLTIQRMRDGTYQSLPDLPSRLLFCQLFDEDMDTLFPRTTDGARLTRSAGVAAQA